jgi:uncharacterized protein (DUF952 family)
MILYHITTQMAWTEAQRGGQYLALSLASEGFIHASTREQVAGTANRFFRGQAGLLLLVIEAEKLTAAVHFDQVTTHGAAQEFPHIYGPINLDAVVGVFELKPEENGWFSPSSLPAW